MLRNKFHANEIQYSSSTVDLKYQVYSLNLVVNKNIKKSFKPYCISDHVQHCFLFGCVDVALFCGKQWCKWIKQPCKNKNKYQIYDAVHE